MPDDKGGSPRDAADGIIDSLFETVARALGPVIAGARTTMLIGHAPQWNITGIAALGAFCYLAIGYRVFKRLEEHFADIA